MDESYLSHFLLAFEILSFKSNVQARPYCLFLSLMQVSQEDLTGTVHQVFSGDVTAHCQASLFGDLQFALSPTILYSY